MDKTNRVLKAADKKNLRLNDIAINSFLKVNDIDAKKRLIQRVQKTQHGFLDIQQAAYEVFSEQSAKDNLLLAKRLYVTKTYQARSLAVFILGRLAAKSKESLAFLKLQVSQDNDWHVQEMLAKAFDRYSADIGYETALPVINEWLADSNPNVHSGYQGFENLDRPPLFS
jgi:hypothetical protein